MWLWRWWHQSLLRSQWRSPLPWPVDSGPGVRQFHHFHIHHSSFSFISVVATSIWPSFSCVNSSVGYLMQDLTVNFIYIYANVYMGTKNMGGGEAQSTILPEMVELQYPLSTKSATYRNQTELKAWNEFTVVVEYHPCQQKYTSKVLLLKEKMLNTRFSHSLICHFLCGILTIPFQHYQWPQSS